MGKTTQTVKAVNLITVFTFFSFLLLNASNSTPTEPIIAEKDSDELAIATDVATTTPTTEFYRSASTPVPVSSNEAFACVFTAPGEINQTTSYDGTGNCTAVLNYIGIAPAVGCTEVTARPFVNGVEIDPALYEFPVDTTVVEWRATDPLTGALTTDDQLVIIRDNEAPNVLTQNITVSLGADGTASILPADIDNGSTDNCAIDSYSLDIDTFGCSDIGNPVSVTLTVTDINGNSNSQTATVTVQDISAPIVLVKNITIPLGSDGTASIVPADIDNGSHDNCGIVSSVLDVDTFSCSDINNPVSVVLTVTDVNGNSDSETATVTVQDVTSPVAFTQNITVQLDASGNASIAEDAVNFGSSDNCGTLTYDTDITSFTCADLGPNTVTLTVTDASGNTDSLPATVTVEDNNIPEVLTQDIIVQLDANGVASITPEQIDNGSNDNCGIASKVLDVTSFDCSSVGNNTVTLTVTDNSGKINTATAMVTVQDKVEPVATTQNITVQLDASGNASIAEDAVNAGSSDNCGTLTYDTDITSFTCADVGTKTVILTVTDASGNTDSAPATVTVVDQIAPVATTQDITVQLDASGNVSIAEDAVNAGSSDNCGTLTYDTDITSFTCADVGTKTVILTVTDASGNTNSAPATVTIVDGIAPVATTQNITVQLDASGNASIAEDAVNSGSSDNCGTLTYDTDITSFTCADVGTKTVNLTVTDANGNTDSASATVTVQDNVDPVASTQNITVQLDASGNASIAEDAVNAGSSDNCGTLTYDTDITSFTCADVGTKTVILTVTDASGNTDSAPATVTVEDNIVPEVLTQDITVQLDANGVASITPDQIDNGSSDNCGIASKVLDVTSFDCSSVGVNTVTLTVTDNNGKISTATAMVTVQDNVDPTITAPANITNARTGDDGTGNCGTTVVLGDPTVGDNCAVLSVKTYVSGAEIDPGTYSFTTGTTEVTWEVTDASNRIKTDTQLVTVVDNEAPVITVPSDVTVDTDNASCEATNVLLGNATANDNCSADAAITITHNAPVVFPLGETVVTWTATDQAGNTTTDMQRVTVVDNEVPTISAPADVSGVKTSDDKTGDCFTAVTLGSPTVSDNCTVLTVKAYVNGSPINPSTHLFPKGTTTVTWEVTDGNDNIATDLQEVTVQDDEAPVIESPSPVTAYTSQDGRGDCSTTAMIGFPAISDNCNSVSTKAYIGNTEINPDIYEFPVGSTTVTWVATDSGGLTSTADQLVTVIDDEAPIPGDLHTINWGCTFTVPAPTATDNCDTSITVTANRSTTFSSSGTIIWTFTDDRGNSSTAEQTINVQPMSANVSSTRTTAYGRNDGTATVNPSGGIAPYTYEWRETGSSSVVSTAKEATILAAGTYEVTVIDVNGCRITEQVEVISAVLPAHISTSACLDVHDYIRTSTFEVDLNNVAGGEGDPNNFTYQWNFGVDATPSTATGPQEHTVTWESSGDKVVYLTITDESDYEQSFAIDHYVGGCFEGCGATSNFVMDTTNFFIGDEFGNPLTGANCDSVTEKYMWIDIIDNANGYALSAEMNYAVNNGEETITGKAIGCFSEVLSYDDKGDPVYDKIPTGLFRLFKVQETGNATDMITWQCGSTFRVEGINIRWTNQSNRGCNEGTKPMCYGPDTEVIVKTPLVVDATPEDILCKGESTGSISVHAAGGLKPYTYNLSGPVNRPYQTSENFYNLPAGEYTYSAKDADTVVTTGTVVITEPDTKVNASVAVTSEITCYGGTGSATVTPSSTAIGTPPYSYSWSSGHTGTTADGLLADITYTVTVTDANNCSVTKEIILTQPPQLTRANAGIDGSFGCGITSTTLGANTPAAEEKGTWSIVSGTGGSITSTDLNDANAPFTGEPGETYVLQWTISKTDGSCANSDTVSITFAEECSTLNFDGIDDHVMVGDYYDFAGTDFTLEAWVRPKSVNGTKTILSKRNTGDMASGGYDLNITNGAVSFRWNNNKVYTTHNVGTDRWYHIAVIFSGGTPKIYVDGILLPLQYDVSLSGNPKVISHPFMIGGAHYVHTPDRPKNLFHGWIEEVRIWKTALSQEQLRFMMNQRVKLAADGASVRGETLPLDVPGSLLWSNLEGYYRLKVTEIDAVNGTTPDMASVSALGYLRNIEEEQENSAPLPYISVENTTGQSDSWWDENSWLYPDYWDAPNSTGINGEKIDWNIAYVSHDLHSGNRDITLLGLLLKSGKLDMLGINPTSVTQAGTGNGLTITRYLDLDGFIDLNGESQLVQPEGSDLVGSGRLERDQQGTGSSFNYNYFSSPVSTFGSAPNSGYTIAEVLRSGTDPVNPSIIDFNYQYHYADGELSNPLKISTYWLYKFHGTAGQYNQWHWVGQNNHLEAGEGYTMKGSSGHLDILDLQNYVFTGMPNNGPITFTINTNENRLLGNPYPSAIDARKFIEQNLKNGNGDYVFNGTLYFWSHFKGKTHYLTRYEGGYAMYNLMGATKAVANDARINATGAVGGMEPRQYIPPGQAFFINTVSDDEVPDGTSKLPLPVGMVGGEISFGNSQRVFQKEDPAKSVFHSKEKPQVGTLSKSEEKTQEEDTRKKIWLKSRSPMGYHRQLLVGADRKTTMNFDPGYDAPVHDLVEEDMHWKLNHMELIIQGVPDFHKGIELPLGITVKHEGDFTIEIDKLENIPDDFAIILKDTVGDTKHDLRKSAFTFTASPGPINGRFFVTFLNEVEPEEQTEEEEVIKELDLFYSREDKTINILNPHLISLKKGALYNLNGQHLRKYDYVPTVEHAKLAVPLQTVGVYIFRLETEEGTKVLKFIIN